MTATRVWTGTEDFDDAWESRETRARLGAHHDEGTGAPPPVSVTHAKTANQIAAGDRIVIGKVTYTVDKVSIDNGVIAGTTGYVNLELLRDKGGRQVRSFSRYRWHEVITLATVRPWPIYSMSRREYEPEVDR